MRGFPFGQDNTATEALGETRNAVEIDVWTATVVSTHARRDHSGPDPRAAAHPWQRSYARSATALYGRGTALSGSMLDANLTWEFRQVVDAITPGS